MSEQDYSEGIPTELFNEIYGITEALGDTRKESEIRRNELLKLIHSYANEARKEPVQACPVCGGRGVVGPVFYNTHGQGVTSSLADITCRTCKGATVLSSKRIAELEKTLTREEESA